jgi:hypothetical protein
MSFHISRHAHEQIRRRGIPPELLDSVLQQPQQVVPQPNGNKVYQSQLDFGSGRIYLLRAVVNDAVDPRVVVTV